jgi:hypothetical protein
MAEFMHVLHSGVRYLVLLAGVGAAISAVLYWRRVDAAATRAQRIALSVFVGLVDLQVLLGFVLLALWPYYPALIGHIVMMVVAAAVAHAGSIGARRREPARPGAPLRLATVAAVLLLIVGGIMAIQRPVI